METVEVIIRLPKKVYEKIQQIDRIISGRRNGKSIEFALWNGVKNGTPLPKGHGRLGDLDALRKEISSWGMNDYEPSDFINEIDMADVIIDADVIDIPEEIQEAYDTINKHFDNKLTFKQE